MTRPTSYPTRDFEGPAAPPAPFTSPRTSGWRRRPWRGAVLAALIIFPLGACVKTAPDEASDSALPADCALIVDAAVSSEKIELLTELAKTFNNSKQQVEGKVACVRPKSKASGGAMQQLADGWAESDSDPRPVIWSPAGSGWGGILDQRLAEKRQAPMAGQGQPFMNTPLVIAMPDPMAKALGWPDKAIGWSDILALTRDPNGWASKGHPEWGPFRLGKTNPNFSTSGLNALVAQNYAAVGKTKDLSLEDLNRPDVEASNRDIESAVVHYGDTTLTFLNNWYRADQHGTSLTYASAVAVEEKSVIDFNTGNPDGVISEGEEPRKPRIPLVAIYPKEGTIFSDNPLYILSAPWVDNAKRDAAKKFQDFVLQPDNQSKVLRYNFRPGNPTVAIAAPIVKDNGVDPDQPQTLLQVPPPAVLTGMLDKWAQQRKTARVLLVLDVSGSMSNGADSKNGRPTKLDLAQQATIDALDEFKDDDLVGLRIFSTRLGPDHQQNFVDLAPVAPIGQNREHLKVEIESLSPTNGTPLYDVAGRSFNEMLSSYDATRINAVVLLTDGKNEDGNPDDDKKQLTELLNLLQSQSQGESGKPVRLFTIGYGSDADLTALKQIAEATNGASYNATDAKTINKIFTQVISNF